MTSARPNSPPGPAQTADALGGARDERAARGKRSAWLLGAFAVAFYVFYIGWYFWRSAGG